MSLAGVSNHVLSSLTVGDLALLQPHLQDVSLAIRDIVEPSNSYIEYAYFPEDGIISVIADGGEGRMVEVGVIGRDGFTAQPVVMGTDRSTNSAIVQVAGHGQRIRSDDLRHAMQTSPTLQLAMLAAVQSFIAQASFTALANGKARIEERMARWLLMAHDRLDGNSMQLTHESLATALGVRRAGVTVALQKLEADGLITTKRKVIEIRDRSRLEALAAEIYSVPNGEQMRLTGWKSTK